MKPKSPAKTRSDNTGSRAAFGSASPSHARLKRLIRKAGGIPKEMRRCPECGGKIAMTDDLMRDRPINARNYRYTIYCSEHHCTAVTGPSVKGVVEEWCDISQNKEARNPG